MDYSLSNSDISRFMPRARIIDYTTLANEYAAGLSLFDIMGPNKTLVLLYLTKVRHGHWTCVFERNNGDIECFDSFGFIPDDELGFIPKTFQAESNQNHTYLLRLLLSSNRLIHYNKDSIQISSPLVNTCGRHVIVRIAFRSMLIDNYIKMIKSSTITPDEIVTIATL